MNRLFFRFAAAAASVGLVIAMADSASAQRGRGGIGRLFGPIPAVTLAQLTEVQQELKLSDEQNDKIAELNDDLSDERRQIFQEAAGDFAKMREDIAELYSEYALKFNALLDEAQQKRAQEVYVQVNGLVALRDEPVAAALKLSNEQKQQVEQALEASRESAFSAFRDFQSLSEEERAKKVEELVQSRDESLLAVLSDEQKQQFEKMKGPGIEVDLSNLPRRGR